MISLINTVIAFSSSLLMVAFIGNSFTIPRATSTFNTWIPLLLIRFGIFTSNLLASILIGSILMFCCSLFTMMNLFGDNNCPFQGIHSGFLQSSTSSSMSSNLLSSVSIILPYSFIKEASTELSAAWYLAIICCIFSSNCFQVTLSLVIMPRVTGNGRVSADTGYNPDSKLSCVQILHGASSLSPSHITHLIFLSISIDFAFTFLINLPLHKYSPRALDFANFTSIDSFLFSAIPFAKEINSSSSIWFFIFNVLMASLIFLFPFNPSRCGNLLGSDMIPVISGSG